MQVVFWFDPVCPFCWMTSRWITAVAPHRDLEIEWRPISLLMKNELTEDHPFHPRVSRTLRMLRVVEALRAAGRADLVGPLYTALGTRVHHEDDIELEIAEVLEHCGCDPTFAAAADDPAHAADYAAAGARGRADIAALDARIAAGFATIATKRIVTFHDAFAYFARAYGIEIVGEQRFSGGDKDFRAQLTALNHLQITAGGQLVGQSTGEILSHRPLPPPGAGHVVLEVRHGHGGNSARLSQSGDGRSDAGTGGQHHRHESQARLTPTCTQGVNPVHELMSPRQMEGILNGPNGSATQRRSGHPHYGTTTPGSGRLKPGA